MKRMVQAASLMLVLGSASAYAQDAAPAPVDESLLGAPGESCRNEADCKSGLACQANTCVDPNAQVATPEPVASTATSTPPPRSEVDAFLAEFAAVTGQIPEGMEDAPSKGTGFLVMGIVLSSAGAVAAAMGGLIVSSVDRPDALTYVPVIAGGAGVAAGVPLLIVGIVKRSSYGDWEDQQLQEINAGGEALLELSPHGLGLGWQGAF